MSFNFAQKMCQNFGEKSLALNFETRKPLGPDASDSE